MAGVGKRAPAFGEFDPPAQSSRSIRSSINVLFLLCPYGGLFRETFYALCVI